jgi:CDP-6-deoxy-D-xylo-4-hexulose-3-dehydrase
MPAADQRLLDSYLNSADYQPMQNEETRTLRDQISTLVEEYAATALAPDPFFPGVTKVPPSGKLLDAAEPKNMVEASLDGWLTIGRFNRQFEKSSTFISVVDISSADVSI